MTVCLAAVCERHKAIVLVADRKLSYGFTAAKGHKIYGIHRDWAVMYAGRSVSKCGQAISEASANIDHLPKTAKQMVRILSDACAKYSCVNDEDRWLLLAGFEGQQPRLFVLADNPSSTRPTVECADQTGYAAIGSGEAIALHVLGMYEQSPYLSLADTVYACCGAKFFSESATDVGPETEVYALYPGTVDIRPMTLIPAIRKAWERRGQLPRPKPIIQRIGKHLSRTTF